MKIGSKLIGLLILAAFLMSACVQSPTTGNNAATNSPAPANGKIKIGFAMATVKEERWQRDRDAFQAQCEIMDVECVL
jgi:D-xylose transport system substrate-binding protein